MKDIEKIDAWLAKTGMSESRLGQLACANSRAIGRIRNGTASVETLWQVMAYIKANPVGR